MVSGSQDTAADPITENRCQGFTTLAALTITAYLHYNGACAFIDLKFVKIVNQQNMNGYCFNV